jgi:hypothetical protein
MNVLFETPESGRNWANNWALIGSPLPEKAARNLATAMTFGQGSNLFGQPGVALMLADSRVDILQVMFGDSETPIARDLSQLYTTVLLGEPERAKTVLASTPAADDGSNFVGLMLCRAWLGLLPEAESRRLRTAVSGNPSNLFGAVTRRELALQGDTGALRVLLDAFGPDSIRFQRGETASIQLVDQRWGSPYVDSQGVASAVHTPANTPAWLGASALSPMFKSAPPESWRDWWACRRALLEFDAASGKHVFLELP